MTAPLTPEQEREAREAIAGPWDQWSATWHARDLLAAALATIEALRAERDAAWADTARQVAAAERVCEIYFNIAAELIGEDAVRVKRDAAIDAARTEAP